MKAELKNALNSNLLLMLVAAVFLDTAFFAVIVATIQVPPDTILVSGLHEVIQVFEG